MKRRASFFIYALFVIGFVQLPLVTIAQTKLTTLAWYYPSQPFKHSFHIASTDLPAVSNIPISTVSNELVEYSKIMLMTTVGAVCYGITHDLITTQINFDYFASDLTHHGPFTRNHYPYIYKSQSKILYALLWGTIATWWVGLPVGLLWAVAARYGDTTQKLTWKDLVKLDAIVAGSMLATSLAVGIDNYLSHHDSFRMVAAMHDTSYLTGILGGIIATIYIYNIRKPITSDAGVFHLEPNGVRIDLANLLFKSNEQHCKV